MCTTNPILRCVPEDDALLKALRLAERVDHSVGKIAPFVLGADVGKVDEVVDSQSQAKTASLPGARAQLLARYL